MASSYCWKLRALLKKNLILMKRNLFATLFEIFFPVILMVVIICLREAFPIETYKFEGQEKTTENYIYDKSITSKTNIFTDPNFDLDTKSWIGLTAIPPLQICSPYNNQMEQRPLIASIGIPLEIKNQMIIDSLEFKSLINFSLTIDSFKEFSSIEEMEEYIKQPKYTGDPNGLICFGLKFSYDKNTKKYDYSLHFFDFDKTGKKGIQDIPSNKETGFFDEFQSGPNLNSFLLYKNGAYSYMMKTVNQYILRQETGDNNAELNYGITAMKYIDYRVDSFGNFLGYMITIIIVIAYMSPLSLYVYRIVGEKETKTKEGMKIMGLGEGEYFLSFFIQYVVISIFVCLINCFLFKLILTRIPLYFLYFTLFLWSLDVFALIYFFQSFIDKTRIALVLSLVIYFIMYCVSLACMFEKTSLTIKVILSFFPAVSLNLGILLMSKFEYHFRNFYDRDFLINHTNYSLGIMYLQFCIDFLVFLFLGFYLHNVLPHDFGIKRPWYFLCTSEYWCNNGKKREKKLKNKEIAEKIEELENQEENNKVKDIKIYKTIEDGVLVEKKEENLYGNSPNFESEEIYKDKTKKDDVLKIRNIVKIFGDGKKAVDGVNLNFYKDEIFALLGHNGAGKTTLISMLTGMYEATDGKAIYDDLNILESINMDIFRQKLGICPQHDILFQDLNIREHLEMFSIFKGVDSINVDNEVNKILHDFQLEDIQYILAKNLSAGQRRKLSIAIALIGGSKVIFLDEPSSGMDITSRRNLWEILKRQCEGKIIILTTHYMEEASVLGKRIGIINAGHMKCIGSPLFLIEKYGKFMSLNITKEEDADNDKIVNFIKNNIDKVEYEILSEEIMFRIQVKDDDNGANLKKLNLSKFFQLLDNNLKALKIKSYSASMPTLEDVFLNVAAEDSKKTKEEKENELLIEKENNEILFNQDLREDYSNKSKFVNDFSICMKRRFLITIRDIKGFLMDIFCPIALALVGLAISQVEMSFKSEIYEIDIGITGKQNILFSTIDRNINIEDFFIKDINGVYSDSIKDLGVFANKKEAVKNFVEKVYDIEKDGEDSADHEVDMTNDNYIGYYSALLLLEKSNNKYEFLILLNTRVKHCIPLYNHYLLKTIIEAASGHKVDIKFTHYPLPLTHDLKDTGSVGNKLAIVFFTAIAFALMPANFISLLVKERINNSKHLMRVSGINIFSYWIVNYIFEIIKYYFTGGVCLLLLWAFDYYEEYLYIFYLTYGIGMISFTYSISFFFNDESNAQNAIILINFLFGDLASIIIVLLRGINSAKKLAKILEYILALVPAFCFNFSFNVLMNKMSIYIIDYPKEWLNFKGDEIIKKFNLLSSMIIYSSAECVLYTIVFIIIESFTYYFRNPTDNKIEPDINDSEVLKEIEKANDLFEKINYNTYINNIESSGREKINSINLNKNKNKNKKANINKNKNQISIEVSQSSTEDFYSVRVKNLRKIYKTGLCSKAKDDIVAIKNLNFCIKPGECFGLLGLNGAGKTTTFKCITQELSQDNGSIFVNGKNIMGRFNELNELFGYCPQFDAIFEHLSVFENLEFYARIKGIREDSINKLVNAMIKEMSLDEFTNKISGRLSGGNKRKLSVAISMLCNPPIILLDEPSTGMDPEARRFMWSVIHKMSTRGRKSSVIMTTHSMDEAETLCKRMGIMVNGEFVCLGKANQIKDKYGYGYEANVRIKPMNEKQQEEILKKYQLDKNLLINKDNINDILNCLDRKFYIDELKEDRLGQRIQREMELNGNVNVSSLLNWIFFVENALKFIEHGKNYFEEIILSEHIENNFLFKMKKGQKTKSIGFFFGLFEERKEKCFITEYSIQQTSLEQIFNKFAANQGKTNTELDKAKIIEDNAKNIIIDDILICKLVKT